MGSSKAKQAYACLVRLNISEGRDEKIINACADAMRKISGVTLLDVDPGKSTNRTVFTFVGDAEAVVEAAFQFSKTA